MLTPNQRMHLQSTGVFVLSLRGAFLYSEESFWGPASVLCLYIYSHFPWRLKGGSFSGSDSDVNSFHCLKWKFLKIFKITQASKRMLVYMTDWFSWINNLPLLLQHMYQATKLNLWYQSKKAIQCHVWKSAGVKFYISDKQNKSVCVGDPGWPAAVGGDGLCSVTLLCGGLGLFEGR